MIRVVVDPGVFISAFISPRRSAPGMLVDSFLDGRFEIVASPHLIAELAEVLARPKFAKHTAGGRADEFIAALVGQFVTVENVAPAAGATADPDDDYLVSLARTHGADAIISGDRHLLDIAHGDPPVWSPRQCAERLGVGEP